MLPFVFWLGAILALIAGSVGVFSRRPILSAAGLNGLMLANSILFLLLSSPLVAFELLLGCLGAAVGFWIVLVRPKRLQLAAPGLERFGLSRLFSLIVVGGLAAVLIGVLDQAPALSASRPPAHALMSGWMGAGVTISLVGSVVATSVAMVRFGGKPDERENR
jgi:NADH:ubiquinone oxidoreductase subunit 6 (subunit J)